MRRLVTSAVLGMLGTALLVFSASAQVNASLGKDGKADYNGQVTKIGYVNGADTSQVKKVTPSSPLPVTDPQRDRDSYLEPTLIYTGTIAAGASDTTSIVDLSAYRNVSLLVQISGTSTNNWQRFAVHARYNLGGAADSLSLFTIPVSTWDDSVVAVGAASRVTGAAAGVLASGEFPVTILRTADGALASTRSLPQAKVVPLTVPQGFVWPSRCSFRFTNIGRTLANTPTVRVWVMGTPL